MAMIKSRHPVGVLSWYHVVLVLGMLVGSALGGKHKFEKDQKIILWANKGTN